MYNYLHFLPLVTRLKFIVYKILKIPQQFLIFIYQTKKNTLLLHRF